MGTRENKVETYLDEQITEIGGLTRKWVSPGRDGVPDRIIIVNGVILFVEIKTTDGTLSPAQMREHNKLTKAGAIVRTVYGHSHVDTLVDWLKRYIV